MHHALFELAGFGELGFEAGDFGVHVGEDVPGCLQLYQRFIPAGIENKFPGMD